MCVFFLFVFLGRNELSYPAAKNERIILTSNTDVHLADFYSALSFFFLFFCDPSSSSSFSIVPPSLREQTFICA